MHLQHVHKMERKDYVMIGLSMALLVSLGFNAMPEPTHYCDSRELQAHCFDVSSTAKTCYTMLGKTGGKRCSEGWLELDFDQIIAIDNEVVTPGRQYLCDNIKCEVKL